MFCQQQRPRRECTTQLCARNDHPQRNEELFAAVKRLEESGHDGTETGKAASGDLDVGSTSSGAGGSSRAGGRARDTAAAGDTSRAGSVSASRASGRGDEESGRVVGADGDSAGGVEGRASSGKSEGVDTRADSGDVSWDGLGGHNSGLVSDGSGLLANGGSDRELASDDTKRVGLGQKAGLGEGVDRRVLSRSDGDNGSGEEDGGTHVCCVVVLVGWCLVD